VLQFPSAKRCHGVGPLRSAPCRCCQHLVRGALCGWIRTNVLIYDTPRRAECQEAIFRCAPAFDKPPFLDYTRDCRLSVCSPCQRKGGDCHESARWPTDLELPESRLISGRFCPNSIWARQDLANCNLISLLKQLCYHRFIAPADL
jgi:hypothetical protein